ncbi:hypothetical protein [Agromyces ramosus]|uniref:Uncharacterized protein n=1 Tax=Agromyces ramosus TaxID=33879 RepID=A0ABU0R8U3_9MICO|nr:hypothetical protein [Agromyces ramosus]MDQ0894496.1 hypothetical protein [Agromyces ramosus]
MRVNGGRGVALGAVVISVGVLMSGCGPIRLEPPMAVAIRHDGTDLEVAVCEGIEASRIYVGARNSETDGEWVTLSELQGSELIEPGLVFRVGDELPGMTAVTSASHRTPVEGEDVNVNIQNSSDAMTVFFAAVPWDDLDGDWFFTDGESSAEPCGHYQEWISTH